MNPFKEMRMQHGFTQALLARRLGVNQTAISQWERGVTTPSPALLLKLCDLYGTSADYLLGREAHRGRAIPVLGQVQAGLPVEAVEDVLDYEEIPGDLADRGDFFALRIRGDSMEPRMREGDVVIVRRQATADTGDIVVALIGEEATIKRLKKRGDGLMLIAFNPEYEPLFYTNQQIRELPVQLLGRVVELRAKL